MFKMPISWFSEEKQTLSLQEMFDPRVNGLYTTQEDFSLKHLVFFLKNFYTRENILEYPRLLPLSILERSRLNGWNTTEDILRNTLAIIPDSHLWLLPFLNLQLTNGALAIYPKRYRLQKDPSTSEYYLEGINSHSSHLDLFDRTTPTPVLRSDITTAISSLFSPAILTYYTDIFKVPNKRFNIFTIPCGGMPSLFFYYASGRQFYTNSGQSIYATELSSIFSSNPAAVWSVTQTENGTISFKLSIPITKLNKSALHKMLNHSSDPLEYLPYPQVMPGEHSPPLFGVELELSTSWTPKQIIDATDEPFLIIKSDSSITGEFNNKYELVTAPTSMRVQRTQWAHFFNQIDYDQFDTNNNTNNGMHVHLDRKNFKDPSHLQAFTWFINSPLNREFMIAVSERTLPSLGQFCAFLNIPATSNLFDNYRNIVERCQGQSRYSAVNFQKRATIEVRFFKGIVSFATVIKNLEFLEAALEFTHNRSIASNNLRTFFAWLEDTPSNKYGTFKKFLNEIDGTDYIEPSNVKELTWGLTNARAIVKRINSRDIPITQKLVTLLNKGKKRTFILNKKTGELETTSVNKGKISHLDSYVAARILGLKPDPKTVIESKVS